MSAWQKRRTIRTLPEFVKEVTSYRDDCLWFRGQASEHELLPGLYRERKGRHLSRNDRLENEHSARDQFALRAGHRANR